MNTPPDPSAPADAYFVCATPRTGSSLLLGLLDATGVAGRPQAYFRAPDEDLWAQRWRLPRPYDRDEFVRAALAHGRTPNGVFGAKLMWDTLEELRDVDGDLPAPLTRAFGAARFIHVRRDDVVAQAVSWLRAEQTGVWFVGGNGEISGAVPTGREPAYDRRRITELIATIDAHSAAWEAWFAAAGIEPYRVRYEQLAADPTATVIDVLRFLGLRSPDGPEIAARHHRQADDLNQQWTRRYRDQPVDPAQ